MDQWQKQGRSEHLKSHNDYTGVNQTEGDGDRQLTTLSHSVPETLGTSNQPRSKSHGSRVEDGAAEGGHQHAICPQGHEMQSLDRKPAEYDGDPFCNMCDAHLKYSTFQHCARCAFDLCAICAATSTSLPRSVCRCGREMRLFTKVPPGFAYWLAGVRCDSCSLVISCRQGLRHCSRCSYDLCPRCLPPVSNLDPNMNPGLK